jgi:hypothetical protein
VNKPALSIKIFCVGLVRKAGGEELEGIFVSLTRPKQETNPYSLTVQEPERCQGSAPAVGESGILHRRKILSWTVHKYKK